eukprot:5034934-Prymnesium_polylepis.1
MRFLRELSSRCTILFQPEASFSPSSTPVGIGGGRREQQPAAAMGSAAAVLRQHHGGSPSGQLAG